MHLYSTRSATLPPPPPRARLAISPSFSVLCGMCYCQPALPTVQTASTESIPRCHHHLQVDLNQIAGPLVLRLVSVLSALVLARLLPVDDPVVRRNLRDTVNGMIHVVCSRVSCALGSVSQPPTIKGSTTLFPRGVPGRIFPSPKPLDVFFGLSCTFGSEVLCAPTLHTYQPSPDKYNTPMHTTVRICRQNIKYTYAPVPM